MEGGGAKRDGEVDGLIEFGIVSEVIEVIEVIEVKVDANEDE